jgi:hypothetical protein
MSVRKTCVVAALVVAAVLAVTVAAGPKEDSKQACDMCKNMGGGSGGDWACPKAVAKECMININGWCCRPTKEHSTCQACGPSKQKKMQEKSWDGFDDDDSIDGDM